MMMPHDDDDNERCDLNASEEGDRKPFPSTPDNKLVTYPLSDKNFHYLKRAAEGGDGESAYALAWHYDQLGNIEKAIEWAKHAVEICKISSFGDDAQSFLKELLSLQKKGTLD